MAVAQTSILIFAAQFSQYLQFPSYLSLLFNVKLLFWKLTKEQNSLYFFFPLVFHAKVRHFMQFYFQLQENNILLSPASLCLIYFFNVTGKRGEFFLKESIKWLNSRAAKFHVPERQWTFGNPPSHFIHFYSTPEFCLCLDVSSLCREVAIWGHLCPAPSHPVWCGARTGQELPIVGRL